MTSTRAPDFVLDKIGAPAWRSPRIVERPDQTRLAANEDERLALVERMIAKRHAIGARREKIRADRLGDPKAAGGIFAVDDYAIERPGLPQLWADGRRAPPGQPGRQCHR